MPKYIDREALLEDIGSSVRFTVRDGVPSAEVRGANKIVDRIKCAPAADVVAVVRCRDCKHENVHRAISDKCTWCNYWGIDPDFDDFCSYGERKDNG